MVVCGAIIKVFDSFFYFLEAGPQAGQWGNCSMSRTDLPEAVLKKMTRPLGWVVFYNILSQHGISISNYWHDPKHIEAMIEEATFFSALNGYDPRVDMTLAKRNFLRLRKAVFVGSDSDDCINPPLSSVFEFLDKDENPLPLHQSLEYRNDTFGLSTMIHQNRVHIENCPGLHHLSWREPKIFDKYVLPHLVVS